MREVDILFENEVNIIWNCSRECINSLRKWYLMNVCRLSYVIWVLEELVHRIPPAADVDVMYDIACTLVQHLKGRNVEHLLKRIQFALPSFHAYGHNATCQV